MVNTAAVSYTHLDVYKRQIPDGAVQFIDVTDRTAVNILLKLRGFLDVVIPRGGAGLIRAVVSESAVPVIETGTGVCHTFVDASADLAMARGIALNAKVSRPAVCNAMETLLVHEAVVADFLPEMLEAFRQAGVEVRGCAETLRYDPNILPASEADWETEYGDLIVSVKIVPDLDAAVGHIARYGTKHSEAIVDVYKRQYGVAAISPVVPRVGTWIEICAVVKFIFDVCVVPRVGTWIEILFLF